MANPYFLACDLSVPTYTWSAGVNASYPVSNLATYYADDVSKSNATTAAQTLLIDFGTATACDCIIIGGHNFGSISDTTVKLQTNTNDDNVWGDANDVQTLFTFGGDPLSDPCVFTFNSQSKRYWRIIFNDSGTLSSAPSVGNIFLGARFTPDTSYEWDYKKANKSYETETSVSLDGRIRTAQSFAGRKQYEVAFRLQTDSTVTSFKTFLGVTRGNLRPFYFVDTDGTTIDYCYLSGGYNPSQGYRYNKNNINLNFQSQLTT